jgi:hypothetical protein
MASIINAVSGGSGGLVTAGDASGTLQIQTGGTTAITVGATQNVTAAGNVTVTGSLTAGSYVGVPSTGLGVDQTWQNVSVTRVSGTTYINTTGKPICGVYGTGGSGTQTQLTININGTGAFIFAMCNLPSGIAVASGTVIIPPNASYVITVSSGALSFAWELR